MEEDTGKSLHVGGATGRIHGADYSLVDYNRAGIPLIEIVTKPIEGAGERAPEVARAYVAELRDLLRALGVSDVRMEQGSLRCDVNVSLRDKVADGQSSVPLGTRTETKNVNSLRSRRAGGALRDQPAGRRAGRRRQRSCRRPGTSTRTPASRRPGRVKEEAEDYRYFPEPDLVPVAPDAEWVEELRGDAARAAGRAARAAAGRVGLHRPRDARRRQRRRARPRSRRRSRPARRPAAARKWWMRRAGPAGQRRRASSWPSVAVTPAQVAELAGAGRRRARSTTSWPARCSTACWPARATPAQVVEARGLGVVSDDGALLAAVDAAIAANPDVAEKVRDGKVAGGRRAGRRGHEATARPGRRRPGPRARPATASLATLGQVLLEPSPAGQVTGQRSGGCRPACRRRRRGVPRPSVLLVRSHRPTVRSTAPTARSRPYLPVK